MKKLKLKEIKERRFVSKLCETFNIREVWKVPIRKKGMTSSGNPLECHWNVRKLVHLYGGKVVIGFELQKHIDGVFKLLA